ncbi:glycosyltransferase family 2 protein [Alphaproteobacteria bacterium]|nr:glycosyltransferase family 2 protein [Alphaproteobacteria bacterium]
MYYKVSYNYNLEKKKLDFVSYIITAYNKRKYLQNVFQALAKEGGSHKREYIVVDDGSYDNSSIVLKKFASKLPGKLIILKRGNLGASYSTNEAVIHASGYWIRLLDGDDNVTYKSTSKMLYLAHRYKVNFVYGLISEKKKYVNSMPFKHVKQSRDEGLKKFIKNCPANSSSILVSKKRYIMSGGCNENFISPDQVLFLRLFSKGEAVFLNQVVAILPSNQSKDRLSSQIKRSRYESILALINFCNENPNLEKNFIKLSFQRALSRANTYNKRLNNIYFSSCWFNYILSKFLVPKTYKKLMHNALKVFSGNLNERPKAWKTRAEKISVSNNSIRR